MKSDIGVRDLVCTFAGACVVVSCVRDFVGGGGEMEIDALVESVVGVTDCPYGVYDMVTCTGWECCAVWEGVCFGGGGGFAIHRDGEKGFGIEIGCVQSGRRVPRRFSDVVGETLAGVESGEHPRKRSHTLCACSRPRRGGTVELAKSRNSTGAQSVRGGRSTVEG